MPDYWGRIKADDRLENARRKLSMDELRMLFQHARDSLGTPPKPNGETVLLSADLVPFSSIVGGGLTLKKLNGRAGFIVNFIGTTEGITNEETTALSQQFAWFVSNYGCFVPARSNREEDNGREERTREDLGHPDQRDIQKRYMGSRRVLRGRAAG